MAGYVALGNNKYIGTLTSASANVEIGMFVTPNYTNGTASLPANDTIADGEVMFVANELTTVVGESIDDINFKLQSGDFLKLKVPQKGEIFVTTNFKPTLSVGDTVAVGDGGTLEGVAARTPKFKFVVKEVITYLGANAVKVVAL